MMVLLIPFRKFPERGASKLLFRIFDLWRPLGISRAVEMVGKLVQSTGAHDLEGSMGWDC